VLLLAIPLRAPGQRLLMAQKEQTRREQSSEQAPICGCGGEPSNTLRCSLYPRR